eukprot:1140262-Pelagomonas_calceolata.AAC.1
MAIVMASSLLSGQLMQTWPPYSLELQVGLMCVTSSTTCHVKNFKTDQLAAYISMQLNDGTMEHTRAFLPAIPPDQL